MSRPFFSVIVPVYNVEKYLRECLDSILNQSYGDFELILVDDGSPDRSGVICDEYAGKDNRVKVIHKINGGVSSARNAGLKAAIGEYILFCDSDDYYLDGAFETIHSKLKVEACDVLNFGYVKELSEDGETKKCRLKDHCIEQVTESILTSLAFVGLLQKHDEYHIEAWAHAFRRDLLLNHHLFYIEELNRSEDLIHIVTVYAHAKKIVYSSDVLYFYRFNSASIMKSFRYSEKSIQNSILYLKSLLNVLISAVENTEKYMAFFMKSLIRVAINPCIVDARSGIVSFSSRKKYIKEVLAWYFNALQKYNLSLEHPVGALNTFECFLVSHKLYFWIDVYTRMLVIYEHKKFR